MKNEKNTRKMRSIFPNSFFFLAAAAVHTPAHLVECSPNEQQREECGKISKAFGTFFISSFSLTQLFFFFSLRLSVDSADSGFFFFLLTTEFL